MNDDDDRQMIANKALQKMKWTASNASLSKFQHNAEPLDKVEFLKLLRNNFNRLDLDSDGGVSREEILDALVKVTDFTAEEYVMLQLLIRYFDFVSELVQEENQTNEAITKQDIDVLAQFILHSDMSLEALYNWCSTPQKQKTEIMPPPLSSDKH